MVIIIILGIPILIIIFLWSIVPSFMFFTTRKVRRANTIEILGGPIYHTVIATRIDSHKWKLYEFGVENPGPINTKSKDSFTVFSESDLIWYIQNMIITDDVTFHKERYFV